MMAFADFVYAGEPTHPPAIVLSAGDPHPHPPHLSANTLLAFSLPWCH